MIHKPLEEISTEDIDSLLENEHAESRTIEYKLLLHGNSDKDKKEFLADVSSFANASGGEILYGIKEENGMPTEIPGLQIDNLDSEKLRLENLIRDSISPRIPGVQIKEINGFDEGPVIIIRIPKSWNSPHVVDYKNTSRFFSRNSAGKYQMNVTELRSAFAESEELPKKIERFIDGRLGKIIAGETPIPVAANPKIVLHVIPYSSFGRSIQIAIPEMRNQDGRDFLRPFYASGYSSKINVDGFVTHNFDRYASIATSYCQIFRAGQIESLDAGMMSERDNGRKTIPSTTLVECLLDIIPKYLQALEALNVPEPVILKLSIMGGKGYKLALVGFEVPSRYPKVIDRDVLHLPDSIVENYDDEIPKIIKPILDGLWNACGYDSCHFYDADGNWITR